RPAGAARDKGARAAARRARAQARRRLGLRPGCLEGRHGPGKAVEPGHQFGMAGAPFALVAKIEIAQGAGERQVPVVGALIPSGWVELAPSKGAIDVPLLALLRGRMPLFLRPEALLIDEQQGRIEDAVAEGAKGQRFDAR